MKVEELLEKITEFLKTEVKTETVVGEPFQLGEFNCVPIIQVGLGLGFGGGDGTAQKEGASGSGAGGGAGIGVKPIGFLVARGDQISFLGMKESKGVSALFEKVPDLMEKMFNKAEKEGKKS